jgi:hypothetical protein
MYLANASFGYGSNGSSSGVVVGAANNGLSLSGSTAQLGQTVGQVGNPAILLSNREIPLGGFSILMSGIGNLVVGSAADGGQKLQIIGTTAGIQQLTKLPAAQTVATPIYQIQKSDGTVWFSMNTNGQWNVFIGVGTGVNTVTPTSAFSSGSSNTAVGFNSFAANTTGNVNVAIGGAALAANTTGSANTAVGQNAMVTNTTGGFNSAFGQAALAFNTTGVNNMAIGQNALRNNTTGGNNVGIGLDASWSNATGSFNVGIGTLALGIAGQSSIFNMSQNIGIGYEAGFNMGAVGVNNIFIGYTCNLAGNVGDSNILIGAAQSLSGGSSNTTLIGTAMIASIGNIVGIGLSTQNIIMGVSNISTDNGARLQVNGNQSLGVVTSAADPLALDNTATHYVFTGTTATWTLPTVAGHTGWFYLIKNRGSGAITLNSNAGGNDIYNTVAVASFTINAGAAFIVANDGTFWLIE